MAFCALELNRQDVYYIMLPTKFSHTSKVLSISVQINSSIYKRLVNLHRTYRKNFCTFSFNT